MPTLTSMSPLEAVVDKINQKKDKGEPGRDRGEVTKSGGTGLGAPENPRPSTGGGTFSMESSILVMLLKEAKQPAKEISKLQELSHEDLSIWQHRFSEDVKKQLSVPKSIANAWKAVSKQTGGC